LSFSSLPSTCINDHMWLRFSSLPSSGINFHIWLSFSSLPSSGIDDHIWLYWLAILISIFHKCLIICFTNHSTVHKIILETRCSH
jgi:hypothetical protein